MLRTGLKRSAPAAKRTASTKLRQRDAVNRWVTNALRTCIESDERIYACGLSLKPPNAEFAQTLVERLAHLILEGDYRDVTITGFRDKLKTLPWRFESATVTKLDLSANALSDHDAALVGERFPALDELILSHNELTKIPTTSNATHLDVSGNRIRSLGSLKDLRAEVLKANDQQLRILHRYGRNDPLPPQLRHLVLRNNGLEPPPEWFWQRLNASNVLHVDVEHNEPCIEATKGQWPTTNGRFRLVYGSYSGVKPLQ